VAIFLTGSAWEFRAQYSRLGSELCDDVAEENNRQDAGCNNGRLMIHFSLELLDLGPVWFVLTMASPKLMHLHWSQKMSPHCKTGIVEEHISRV
jgi:hypothetical protein